MRVTIILALPLAAMAGACVSTQVDKDGTILTPSEANRAGIEGAVSAPLRDVNVLRTKIPTILLTATAEPYARPRDPSCAGITVEVRSLDEALGPDLDAQGDGRKDRLISREKAENIALGMVADTAQDVIPFRGWVRKLTGAERHDKLVTRAINAGEVRRAYLKGLGEARGCNPPATPAHLAETPEPIKQLPEPAYPIK